MASRSRGTTRPLRPLWACTSGGCSLADTPSHSLTHRPCALRLSCRYDGNQIFEFERLLTTTDGNLQDRLISIGQDTMCVTTPSLPPPGAADLAPPRPRRVLACSNHPHPRRLHPRHLHPRQPGHAGQRPRQPSPRRQPPPPPVLGPRAAACSQAVIMPWAVQPPCNHLFFFLWAADTEPTSSSSSRRPLRSTWSENRSKHTPCLDLSAGWAVHAIRGRGLAACAGRVLAVR